MNVAHIAAWCCALLAIAGLAHEIVNLRDFPLLTAPKFPWEPGAWRRRSRKRVVACVAMRNEERNAASCIASLLSQPEIAAIVVCDDGSTDGTVQVLDQLGADARLQVIRLVGAAGKSHALAQAAFAARRFDLPYLFFTDADVRAEPDALRTLLDYLHASGVDAVSVWPRTRLRGFWDAVLAPLVVLFLLQLLPLRLARSSSDERFAAGNGQAFLVRRDAYERSGGHTGGAIVEDVALARTLKRSGARIALASGSKLFSVNGYGLLRSNVEGYGRSLYFGGGHAATAAYAIWQALAFAVPWATLVWWGIPSVAGVIAGFLAFVLLGRRMGFFAMPLIHGALSAVVAVAGSIYILFRGASTHLTWRNRIIGEGRRSSN